MKKAQLQIKIEQLEKENEVLKNTIFKMVDKGFYEISDKKYTKNITGAMIIVKVKTANDMVVNSDFCMIANAFKCNMFTYNSGTLITKKNE
jgi:hypothetical protein